MNIPRYARYEYCMEKACEFLEQYGILSYPIDVEKIIISNKWGLTPYSLLMTQFNCNRDAVIHCLGSKDGYTQLDKDNYSIAYNDDPSLGDRKRFTLMHEIGHIYLNHLSDFDIKLFRCSLTKEENIALENEANSFARNVLAPISLIQNYKIFGPEKISKIFGISYVAANTRINLLQADYQNMCSAGVLERMNMIYINFYSKTACNNCNATFLIRYRLYCPICGAKNTLGRGNGDMNYIEYNTNNEGFLIYCLQCGNEKIVGNYCHICGAPVRNYCTNATSYNNNYESCVHSEPLSGNARYCPDCGSESLFYQKNILYNWNEEHSKYNDNSSNVEKQIDVANLPFQYNEESLPFH